MKFLSFLLLSLALAVLAAATPLNLHPRQNTTTGSGTACSSISSLIQNAPATATPTLPAGLAYDCLTSAPINKTAALELLEAMKPYLTWQSTTTYLANPPAEYVEKIQEPHDLWQALMDIEEKVHTDVFTGEFEFGWAVYKLFQSAHDGHFVYVPDSVGAIFTWARSVPLVSISEDGRKLPAVFAYPDILQASFPNSTYAPSAIVKINGEDATAYLLNWSQLGSLQDRDALYNNVFYELGQVQLGSTGSGTGTFTGGGRGRWAYPGAETVFEFANGTTKTYENFARAQVSFRGVENGTALADRYFLYESSAGAAALAAAESAKEQSRIQAANMNHAAAYPTSAKSSTVSRATPAPGYPSPVIYQSNNLIAGYYLDGDEYSDVAVLSVPSFVGSSSAEEDFQEIGSQFLSLAKAAGKTKLIIDVSGNGGGTILQGFDLFKQLFPSVLPYGGTRFRAHEMLDLLGQKFSYLSDGIPRDLTTVENNYTMADIVVSAFNYRTDADEDYKPFTSWAEKYGPHENHGDNFTSIIRWNMSDPLNPLNSGGIEITGYGNRSNYTTVQPFESANIVIVYDGYCASTCAIFSELMRQQGNVSTIAFGGRPQYGAMQAVGGVKGTNNFEWAAIQQWVQDAYEYADAAEKAEYNQSYEANYVGYTVFNRAASTPEVNVRDGIRHGDSSGTPLQFVYEEADCRIFYTAAMTMDATAIWKAAADSQWSDLSHCVAASAPSAGAKRDEEQLTKRAAVPKLRERDLDLERSLEIFTDLSAVRMDGDGLMLP